MLESDKNKYIVIAIGIMIFLSVIITININMGLKENLAKATMVQQIADKRISADKIIAEKKEAADKVISDAKAAQDQKIVDAEIASDKAIADAKIIANQKTEDAKAASDAQAAAQVIAQAKRVADAKIVSDRNAANEKAQQEVRDAQAQSDYAYTEWVKAQFNPEDLSCPSLMGLVRGELYFRSTFQLVSTTHTDNGNHTLTIWMTYTAMNLDGVTVLENVTAVSDYNTGLISITSRNNF